VLLTWLMWLKIVRKQIGNTKEMYQECYSYWLCRCCEGKSLAMGAEALIYGN